MVNLPGLTHVLGHPHLHVLLLKGLHCLQGLLWIHLLIHSLHGLREEVTDTSAQGPNTGVMSMRLRHGRVQTSHMHFTLRYKTIKDAASRMHLSATHSAINQNVCLCE